LLKAPRGRIEMWSRIRVRNFQRKAKEKQTMTRLNRIGVLFIMVAASCGGGSEQDGEVPDVSAPGKGDSATLAPDTYVPIAGAVAPWTVLTIDAPDAGQGDFQRTTTGGRMESGSYELTRASRRRYIHFSDFDGRPLDAFEYQLAQGRVAFRAVGTNIWFDMVGSTLEQSCGGFAGIRCPDGSFCDYAPDTLCGAADRLGTCRPTPDLCPQVVLPVCGCDGRDYTNACKANRAGVSVAKGGPCTGGGGGEGQSCGGLAGLRCNAGLFCDYTPSTQCGIGDQLGTCTAIPDLCPQVVLPVCGCDGQTYTNGCMAHRAGVALAHDGACS
jgi:hypothetical protein